AGLGPAASLLDSLICDFLIAFRIDLILTSRRNRTEVWEIAGCEQGGSCRVRATDAFAARAGAIVLLRRHGSASDLCRSCSGAGGRGGQNAGRDGAWRGPYRRLLHGDAGFAAGLGTTIRCRRPPRLRAGLARPWPLAAAGGFSDAGDSGCRQFPA